ncbi:MBL fold metallo-hydrolase [Deinococcus navajonensis]|uniref:MBL fold metallo-hydrolase n=1 Tax=Deinococcus navajonensis TaxID=309884 RepID=A0ABV8XNS1_9DEIO
MSAPASAPRLTRTVTAGGGRVYTLSVRAFEGLSVNVFVIVLGDPARPGYTALVDTGSGLSLSTEGLAGLAAIRGTWGEACSWASLDRIVVTHAHPDHAGGLPFVRTLSAAPVAAHERGVPILENPEAFREAMRPRLEAYQTWLGVPAEHPYGVRLGNRTRNLMLPSGVPVATPLQDGDLLDGVFRVIFTPGHEGSQICLQLDDVLLSADHVLPRNSPPLLPAWVHEGGGLETYLASLDKVERLEGVGLALGGHDEPMPDWRDRIQALRARYEAKLAALLEAADQPRSVLDLTERVSRMNPRQALLLLDQTAALAEFLVARGQLHQTQGTADEALFVRQG